jgi:hypothetical protein
VYVLVDSSEKRAANCQETETLVSALRRFFKIQKVKNEKKKI